MNASEVKNATPPRMRIDIPFEMYEGDRFDVFMETRGAKKGPFFRQLALTLMDPVTGPIVESAMRGRTAPDLTAGQAREAAAALSVPGNSK